MLVRMEKMPSTEVLLAIPGITSVAIVENNLVRIHFNGPATLTQTIVTLSVTNGWLLSEIQLERSSLEEIFAQLSNNPKLKTA
jgi:ABC-2 type transport system ATP-binding protein